MNLGDVVVPKMVSTDTLSPQSASVSLQSQYTDSTSITVPAVTVGVASDSSPIMHIPANAVMHIRRTEPNAIALAFIFRPP